MRTLMSGWARVHYGQIYIVSGPEFPDDPLGEGFGGQRNGLCGAAVPGFMFLITGSHTGDVGFTVELHETPPSVSTRGIPFHECEVRFRGRYGGYSPAPSVQPSSGADALIAAAIALMLDELDLADPRIGLAQHDAELLGELDQFLPGPVHQLGVGRLGDVLGLHSGVNNDAGEIAWLHGAGSGRD